MDFFAARLHQSDACGERPRKLCSMIWQACSWTRRHPDILSRAIERVLPHLEGAWSAAACAPNPYNEEMDLAGAPTARAFGPEIGPYRPPRARRWSGKTTRARWR